MEFEEVNHVFNPFGYGNLMGVKYSHRQRGERFAAVKATVSPGSVSVVTRFLEMRKFKNCGFVMIIICVCRN